MATQTCKRCDETFDLSPLHFAPNKKFANGFDSHCRPCRTEARREAVERRNAGLTPEEVSARHEATKQRKRAYNEKNKDELAKKRKLSKARSELPKDIQELRFLSDCVDASTLIGPHLRELNDTWKAWAKEMVASLNDRYGVKPFDFGPKYSRLRDDPMHIYIEKIKGAFADGHPYQMGMRIQSRYDELREKVEAYSAEELHAALTYEPRSREPSLSPADKKIIDDFRREWEEYEANLTDEQIAERSARWEELLAAPITPAAIARLERAERDEMNGKTPTIVIFDPLEDDPDDMGGFARHMDYENKRKEEAEKKRVERNRKARAARANKKKRLAQKATSASKRRAEGRKT